VENMFQGSAADLSTFTGRSQLLYLERVQESKLHYSTMGKFKVTSISNDLNIVHIFALR
jgi:hypothetical protein